MSSNLDVYVEQHQDDGTWKELKFYNAEGKVVYFFDNSSKSKLVGEDNVVDIMRGIPEGFTHEESWDEMDRRYFSHNVTWYDYCELDALKDTPRALLTDEDWGYEAHNPINVLIPFVAKVDALLEAYNIWFPKPGDIRIVCVLV